MKFKVGSLVNIMNPMNKEQWVALILVTKVNSDDSYDILGIINHGGCSGWVARGIPLEAINYRILS